MATAVQLKLLLNFIGRANTLLRSRNQEVSLLWVYTVLQQLQAQGYFQHLRIRWNYNLNFTGHALLKLEYSEDTVILILNSLGLGSLDGPLPLEMTQLIHHLKPEGAITYSEQGLAPFLDLVSSRLFHFFELAGQRKSMALQLLGAPLSPTVDQCNPPLGLPPSPQKHHQPQVQPQLQPQTHQVQVQAQVPVTAQANVSGQISPYSTANTLSSKSHQPVSIALSSDLSSNSVLDSGLSSAPTETNGAWKSLSARALGHAVTPAQYSPAMGTLGTKKAHGATPGALNASAFSDATPYASNAPYASNTVAGSQYSKVAPATPKAIPAIAQATHLATQPSSSLTQSTTPAQPVSPSSSASPALTSLTALTAISSTTSASLSVGTAVDANTDTVPASTSVSAKAQAQAKATNVSVVSVSASANVREAASVGTSLSTGTGPGIVTSEGSVTSAGGGISAAADVNASVGVSVGAKVSVSTKAQSSVRSGPTRTDVEEPSSLLPPQLTGMLQLFKTSKTEHMPLPVLNQLPPLQAMLQALTGFTPHLSQEQVMAALPLLIGPQQKSVEALRLLLKKLLNLQVVIQPFEFAMYPLPVHMRACLVHHHCVLGHNIQLGSHYATTNRKFTVVLGPMTYEQFTTLQPQPQLQPQSYSQSQPQMQPQMQSQAQLENPVQAPMPAQFQAQHQAQTSVMAYVQAKTHPQSLTQTPVQSYLQSQPSDNQSLEPSYKRNPLLGLCELILKRPLDCKIIYLIKTSSLPRARLGHKTAPASGDLRLGHGLVLRNSHTPEILALTRQRAHQQPPDTSTYL